MSRPTRSSWWGRTRRRAICGTIDARPYDRSVGWVRRISWAVAGASRRSPLRLLAPLRTRLLGEMRVSDVLEVVGALEASDIGYSLAGGWGVDALVGRQTRRHADLDVVLERFDADADRARAALRPLGFELVARERSEVKLPDRLVLAGRAGRSVDFVSIDVSTLGPALGAGGAGAVRSPLFATGTVGGRVVSCVSGPAQRALRAGYPPRPVDRHDLRVLSGHRTTGEPRAVETRSGRLRT